MNSAVSKENPSTPSYEIILRPRTGWFFMDWGELWEYRDLLLLLIRRDFVSKYKQTILGPAWFILQPLLMTMVMTLVFAKMGGIQTDGIPPMLFYLANYLGWNYFAQNINTSSTTFTSNAQLFGKVYFPRLIVPVSVVISNIFALLLQFMTFAGFYIYYRQSTVEAANLSWGTNALFVPLLIVQIAALSLGVGLLLSALSAKYRDLTHLTPFLLQVWMFATVIFPLSQLPEQFQWLTWANPMAVITEAIRYCLLGKGLLLVPQLVSSVVVTLLTLVAGIIIFQKTERSVVDSV